MELRLFAQSQPRWQFDGVDPSRAVLTLAEQTLERLINQVQLHEGYIETAPDGPFDAATCLLALHFLAPDDRLRTLLQIRRRIKPGGPLVMAHHSIATDDKSRAVWAKRFAAFGASWGATARAAPPGSANVFDQLPVLSPDQEAALLQEAGFSDVTIFYAAFTFRSRVAYA